MKKSLTNCGLALLMSVALIACEQIEMTPTTNFGELKRANNGMIKSYSNETILKWNELLSQSIDSKMPAPAESRIYAMVTIAVHDALNNVVPEYETYAMDNSWNDGKMVSKKTISAVADAAVSQAAHDVLVALYSDALQSADDLLASVLTGIDDSELKDQGIQIGIDAASAMLAKRANDVLPAFMPVIQGTEPGQYRSTVPFTATGLSYGQGWGQTTPFGVMSGDQFRPDPPFAVNSPEYTADYNEVKAWGSNTSSLRTSEQTAMSLFVTDNMPCLLNKVARSVAVQQELDGWETARLFALLQMAEADMLICTFEAIYYYKFWRPVTAINQGANDGNDDTEGDAAWIPLLSARITPPLPTYPSSYAAGGTAAEIIFNLFFGKKDIPFSITSYTLPGVERNYSSVSQLAEEMNVSRVYVGHSFRNDGTVGGKMGVEIGQFVFENNLRPR